MDSPTLIGCVDGGPTGLAFRAQSATSEQILSQSETLSQALLQPLNCEPGGDRATGLILDCLWRLFGHEEVEAFTSTQRGSGDGIVIRSSGASDFGKAVQSQVWYAAFWLGSLGIVEIFELAKRPKTWSLAAQQFSVAQVNLGNDERFCRVCSPEVVEYVLGFSELSASNMQQRKR